MAVQLQIPATCANLGPGFDTLGLAVSIYNYLEVDIPATGPGLVIQVTGEGAKELPDDEGHLVYQSLVRVFHLLQKPVPRLFIRQHNTIPLCSGLGSSAAAIVGGLFAANELLQRPLSRLELLNLAQAEEQHPDNITPAMYGGITAACADADGVRFSAIRPAPCFAALELVLAVPNCVLATKESRRALPPTVSFADAAFNAGRAALLVAALTAGDAQHLRLAMQDRLHQPYRLPLVAGLPAVLDAALEAGALGAVLSGAGPTVVALTLDGSKHIGRRMQDAFSQAGITSTIHTASVSPTGVQIIRS